ncbi:MAG: hypothetical protein ACJ79S_22085 [Gemmatimonadaceae bacterium]
MARKRDDQRSRRPDAPRPDTSRSDAPLTNERTTVRAEEERREALEREQREHPDEIAGRHRDPWRDVPVDADDDSERFRARDNEDVSEG